MPNKRDLVKEASASAKNMQVSEIQTIKAAWDKFDLNGDGVVSTSEVDSFLGHLKIKIPDSDKENILKQLDRNGNGTIEFVEFVMNFEKGLFKNYGI